MTRELEVRIEDTPVGTLIENAGVWSLRYEPSWIENGFPLAPGLPLAGEIVDSGTQRPVQWYFDNLLPEDAALDRLMRSLGGGALDAWRLLERFGSESAGALTLLRPGQRVPEPALRMLSDDELESRIRDLPTTPLAQTAPKKMSLAGTQEKLLVFVSEDGRLHEPIGSQASSHILKPDALAVHYPASTANEWFCARLAQALKLDVPTVELRYVPSSVYLIRRFDRRIHAIDAAQCLSLYAGFKYARSGAQALRDIVGLLRTKAPARLTLFRWTVFNLLIGNADAHLKNISVFAGRDGYALAPFYDLVSTAAWATPELAGTAPRWPDIELSFPIGSARTFADIRIDDVLDFAGELDIPRRTAAAEFARLTGAVIPAADTLLAEFKARTDVPRAEAARQPRMLDSIRHLPLAEMQARLAC